MIGSVNINNGNTALIKFDNYVSDNIIESDGKLVSDIILPLSEARCRLAATSISNYAIFAGGGYEAVFNNTVDVYSNLLIKTIATPLSIARYSLSATELDDYALFAGGEYTLYGRRYSNSVDIYDESLVRTLNIISIGRGSLAAASINGYALFAGGIDNSLAHDRVDIYYINFDKMRLELPIGAKYKFTEHSEELEVQPYNSPILINSPATGYIKIKSGIIENLLD